MVSPEIHWSQDFSELSYGSLASFGQETGKKDNSTVLSDEQSAYKKETLQPGTF